MLFIHSSNDELGRFHFLAIVINAAMNIHVQVLKKYLFTYLALLGLSCGTQDHMGSSLCHVGSSIVAHGLSSCGA